MAALVDVGIPTHGSPTFLAEAIESVLGQTLGSITLTISENGPGSEEIAAIVRPYLDDPRVRHVRTGSNLGGARNSTRLLNTGRAPYVAILHDDDRWQPGFLARRVEFLEHHPGCAFVFSPCDFVDARGSLVYRFEVDLEEGVQERRGFLRKLYRRNLVCTPTVLGVRACYEAVGPEFDESVLFYDYEMWLRLASRYDVGFLATTDAGYRVHRTQTTQEVRRHWGEHRLAVLDRAERMLPEDFPRIARRRIRSETLLKAAVDALGRGDGRALVRHLGQALREHPAAPIDPWTYVVGIGWLRRRGVRSDVNRAALSG